MKKTQVRGECEATGKHDQTHREEDSPGGGHWASPRRRLLRTGLLVARLTEAPPRVTRAPPCHTPSGQSDRPGEVPARARVSWQLSARGPGRGASCVQPSSEQWEPWSAAAREGDCHAVQGL